VGGDACTGCACGTPHDQCTLEYQTCTGMCGAGNVCSGALTAPNESCYPSAPATPQSVTVTKAVPAPPQNGSCDPSGSPIAPDVQWLTTAVRCDPPGGGACGGGDVCLPAAQGVDTCVWQLGNGGGGCPPGYPVESTYLEGGSYSCPGNCGCGKVIGTTCDPATLVTLFTDAACSSIAVMVDSADGHCTGIPVNMTIQGIKFSPRVPGSCVVDSPTAQFSAGQAVTVCCST
jgi:hypothetical protein